MKKLFNFAALIFIFILNSPQTRAEYTIFKIVKNPLTRQSSINSLNRYEFKQVYQIVTQYKWPTNVFTFYSHPGAFPIDYNNPFAEEEFIRSKIKALNDDYEIAFIPDIIYESAFLGRNTEGGTANGGQYEEGAQEIQANILTDTNEYKAKLLEDNVKQIVTESFPLGEARTYYNILAYMYNLNLHPTTVEIAFRINNEIVSVIKKDLKFIRTLVPATKEAIQKSSIPFRKSNGTSFKVSLTNSLRTYFQLFDNPQATWNNLINKSLLKPIIQKIAKMEYQAAHNNDALLFRGSQGQDSPLRLHQNAYKNFSNPLPDNREKILLNKTNELQQEDTFPYSISFGFSLMAGMATESGGNVYRFMISYGGGYALKIHKKEFFDIKRSYLRGMFFIPPFGTVFSYYATDDLFHPRTRVGKGQDITPDAVVIDQLALRKDTKTAWIIGVNKLKNWDDMAADLANYIAKEGNTELIYPLNKNISGQGILSTFHTELLHFKQHTQRMAPVFQDIKSRNREVPSTTSQAQVSSALKKKALPPTPPIPYAEPREE